MGLRHLTLEEVERVGRKVRAVRPLEHEHVLGKHVFGEWIYEDGFVWLNIRDADHTHSARLVPLSQAPQTGWRHDSDCDCSYCAARAIRLP